MAEKCHVDLTYDPALKIYCARAGNACGYGASPQRAYKGAGRRTAPRALV
jgi:hypothetical protein